MHGSVRQTTAHRGDPPPTLAQRPFPRRVREILRGILEYASDELGRGLDMALAEYEQGLLQYAEQSPSADVRENFARALRALRGGNAKMQQDFRRGLEGVLAQLRDAPATGGEQPAKAISDMPLSLVDDIQIEETIVLNEMSHRVEMRNSLPLFLLGQRFGVLAASPAFDAETLPIGPRQLCRLLQHAAEQLDLAGEHRLQLYKYFDRECLQKTSTFYDALNSYLIGQRVLPNLTFVPIRPRPVAQNAPAPTPTAERGSGSAKADLGIETVPHEARPDSAEAANRARAHMAELVELLSAEAPEPQPATRWPGQPDPSSSAAAERQDAELFTLLSELMSGRRALVGKLGGKLAGNASDARPAGIDAVQSALARLQAQRPQFATKPEKTHTLKQNLLAQLRQIAGGEASALAEPDVDAIELVGLLLEHVLRELRPGSPATPMVGQLQLPLLRVALADKGFFTRRQHPARQMLNAVAEASEFLNPEDPADAQMLQKMRALSERASHEYDGNPVLFESLLSELNQHLQSQSRKAEVAERRHVEAARGKEKLETARMRAAETLDGLLAGKRIPRFLRTLLSQAWSDVLALTLLRAGEDSDAYAGQLQIAARLIEAAVERRRGGRSPIAGDEAQQLRQSIETSLVQVGYHTEDAEAIATRLLALSDEEEDDSASSTELAMRLKQRVRFGQDSAGDRPGMDRIELNAAEQAELERIEKLPLGTWFEFKINQQEVIERRRLSWFSTVTGYCLFLNHRGQRVGEYSLNWLAREVARGNVRIVMEPPGTVVDRAWGAIVRALRSFSGSKDAASGDTP